MTLAGRLNHVAYILPQLRSYLRSTYQWQKEWHNHLVLRPISDKMKEDLDWWRTALETYTPTRLIPDPDLTDVGWVGDASTSYGIGVIIGKKWVRFRLLVDPQHLATGNPIAWLKTVAVRLGLLMLIQIGSTLGKVFIVQMYNTTTQGAISQRKSRDTWVNCEWRAIQQTLLEAEIDLKAQRVTSAENRADQLSRGKRENHLRRDALTVTVPPSLCKFICHQGRGGGTPQGVPYLKLTLFLV
jgi:hypothetical protein